MKSHIVLVVVAAIGLLAMIIGPAMMLSERFDARLALVAQASANYGYNAAQLGMTWPVAQSNLTKIVQEHR